VLHAIFTILPHEIGNWTMLIKSDNVMMVTYINNMLGHPHPVLVNQHHHLGQPPPRAEQHDGRPPLA